MISPLSPVKTSGIRLEPAHEPRATRRTAEDSHPCPLEGVVSHWNTLERRGGRIPPVLGSGAEQVSKEWRIPLRQGAWKAPG